MIFFLGIVRDVKLEELTSRPHLDHPGGDSMSERSGRLMHFDPLNLADPPPNFAYSGSERRTGC
jgi:hypothetical protein